MRNNQLTVKQLNEYLKNIFEDELVLQNLCIVGEVFDLSVSKYIFLTIKEDDSLLNCVCFNKIVLPTVGAKVLLTGSVKYNAKSGNVSFVFKDCATIGNGLCQAEYLITKEKLKNKGYFDRKKPLPNFISGVGIITSGYGSVIHDFLSGIADGNSYIDVSILRTSVQGSSAAGELISSLKKADKLHFDAVVVARGGGSAADLEPFNSEEVAETVALMHTPIISAVGHETDYTLCDLCADVRAGTPSFAAKIIAENNNKVIGKFVDATQRLSAALLARQNKSLMRYSAAVNRLSVQSACKISDATQTLFRLTSKLTKSIDYRYYDAAGTLNDIAKEMNARTQLKINQFSELMRNAITKIEYSNPTKILSKGFAAVTKNQQTVYSVDDLSTGDEIEIILNDGIANATINNKERR